MALSKKELLTRLISITQIITAIVITGVGIGITVKFRKIHHERNTPYEAALNYIDNPWTTTYAAGVWMGLIIGIAGILGMFVDLKPHKDKYKYYTLGCNIIVLLVEIVLVVFSVQALSWYKTCRYVWIMSSGRKAVNNCSDQDKASGNTLYTIQIAFLLINAIATIGVIAMTLMNDMDLFRDLCNARRFKGKSTHQFNQEANPEEYNGGHQAARHPVEYHSNGPSGPKTYV